MIGDDETLADARILIVDDKPANVVLLEALLDEEGYTNVTGLTDPRQVLPLHAATPFDIILLDIRMPYLGGHALLRLLDEERSEGTMFPFSS